MHQCCKEPDWRLSGKMLTASSTQHLAGGEKRSKSVYGELYSAVTSTGQATTASHSTLRAGGNGAPKTPSPFPQLSCRRSGREACGIPALAWDQSRQHGEPPAHCSGKPAPSGSTVRQR